VIEEAIVRETVICFDGNCWLHTVIDGVAQTTWIGRKGRGDVRRYARAQHLELIDLDSARDGSVAARAHRLDYIGLFFLYFYDTRTFEVQISTCYQSPELGVKEFSDPGM
jgi:hypothetical protein